MGIKRFVSVFPGQLSTLLLLLSLGALGYWGHRTDWKAPKVAALWSSSSSAAKEDKGGERDEDSPSAVKVIPPAEKKDEGSPSPCPLDQTHLQFSSPEAVEKVGIKVEAVEEKSLFTYVSAPGEIDYDQTRVSRLAAPVSGRVWRVDKEVGDRVKKGEVVALVEATKVGEAKAEFLQAVVQMELKVTSLKNLQTAGSAVAERQIQEAQAEVRAARVRMYNAQQALVNLGLPISLEELAMLPEEKLSKRVQFLGLPESITKTLDPATTTANLVPLTSPFDGVVAERQVVSGEVVEPTTTLITVADLSRIWIRIDTGMEDTDQLALGQEVTFFPDGHPGEEINGKLSWMSTTVDEKTRTMPVRAVVDNPQEHFRAHTFGTAQITVLHKAKAVMVPLEAVQRDSGCTFVFVRLSDTDFQVREVHCDVRSGKLIEVHSGLKAGEVVVTKGSHILKTETLKSRVAGDDD